MSADLIRELFEATLASSMAIALLLALRRPLRRWAGPGVAYGAWAVVPLAMVAVCLPAPVVGVPVLSAAPAAVVATGIATVAGARADAGPWLLAAWAAGALVLAAVFAERQRRFVHALAPIAGMPFLTNPRGGPAVVGLLRPRIVLPAGFAERYSDGELALVIAHERAHVRRGDLIAQALSTLLRCVFWFNPLVPLAERRFRDDQEMACDEAVLRLHPRSRRDYGSAMLKTHLADTGLPLGCHWQSGHSLKERISMLKQPLPGTLRRRTAGSIVALSLLAAATVAWATQPARSTDAGNRATTARAPAAEEPAMLKAVTGTDVLTAPPYPAEALADGVSGLVVLDVRVDAQGLPAEIRIFSSQPEGVFDAAALDAARAWRFNAGRNGAAGTRVEGWVRIPVQFEPHGNPDA